jgi:histidyl-tRNA synthetase
MDRGDRRVTLRPEMTPTLARMVAAKRRELTFPLRWFSLPNVFRYERPQKGRLREHYQLNVDLLGVSDLKADGEIIVIAHALLTELGAKNDDFVIRLNSRALLDVACLAAGLKGEAKRSYLRLLDRKAKLAPETYSLSLKAITTVDPLRLIEQRDEHVRNEVQRLEAFIAAFAARGMTNVVFDPQVVRGFDYYTGIVFEIYDTNTANPRALFGGGRYDNLVGMFGGEPIPAVGFGMGDVTLSDFLETHGIDVDTASSRPQLYVGTPSLDDLAAAQKLADELRAKGSRVFVNISERSLGDQIKDAVKRGIPYFIAYGSQEVANNTVRMKTLATGEETALPITELPNRLQSGS